MILDGHNAKRGARVVDAEGVAEKRPHDVVRQARPVGKLSGVESFGECDNEKMRSMDFAGVLRDDQRPALMGGHGDQLPTDMKEEGTCLLRGDPADELGIDEFFSFSLEPSTS